jgi:predicted metal-dependent hydrolase
MNYSQLTTFMADKKHTIKDKDGNEISVFVRRDKRLKKSSRWQREANGSILLRIPYRFPKRQIPELLEQITQRLDKRIKQAQRRTDADLQQRAEFVNKTYFGGQIEWEAIRWVGNMNHRLGSCTNGGSTDGHIRISEKIKDWPQWVIDYVISHELVHRLHSNHSKDFWAMLTKGYPKTEQARGFIQGIGFAEGQSYKDD